MSHYKQVKWALRYAKETMSNLQSTARCLNEALKTVDCPKDERLFSNEAIMLAKSHNEIKELIKTLEDYLGKE